MAKKKNEKLSPSELKANKLKREAAREVVVEIARKATTEPVLACTEVNCPFCTHMVCQRGVCWKDKDETVRQKMPRQVAEDIESVFVNGRYMQEQFLRELAESLGVNLTAFAQYRREQEAVKRYLMSVKQLEADHKRGQRLTKKVEDIKKPEITVHLGDCVPDVDETIELLKKHMVEVDFDRFQMDLNELAHQNCKAIVDQAMNRCTEMIVEAKDEIARKEREFDAKCVLKKAEVENYVQIGRRIVENVDQIQQLTCLLTGQVPRRGAGRIHKAVVDHQKSMGVREADHVSLDHYTEIIGNPLEKVLPKNVLEGKEGEV